MHIQITLDGSESLGQMQAIARAVLALSDQAPHQDVVVNQTFMSLDEARQEAVNLRVPKEVAEAVEANLDGALEAFKVAAIDAVAEDIKVALAASAVPLPPVAPSTADASASPTAPAASEVFAATSISDASPSASTNPVPAAAATGLVLDGKGLPWDARIHAGSKTQNADGSWRQRRNLNDPALVTRVEAELRSALSVGTSYAQTEVLATSASPAIASSSSIPTPPASAQAGQLDFAGFMKWYVPLVTAQAITVEQTAEILKTIPLASITMLGVRPDLIPQVKAAIEAQL
jgi:hypothetical protein